MVAEHLSLVYYSSYGALAPQGDYYEGDYRLLWITITFVILGIIIHYEE